MKKIASLLLFVAVSLSCTTDVTRNDPALEGVKDGDRWRARDIHAELLPNQNLRIIGQTQYETITLVTTNKIPMTYTLGIDTAVTATFHDSSTDLTYATGFNSGDGEIVIKNYDPIQMTVTGTFRFNAPNVGDNPAGGPTLNFQYGNFYKVPFIPAL